MLRQALTSAAELGAHKPHQRLHLGKGGRRHLGCWSLAAPELSHDPHNPDRETQGPASSLEFDAFGSSLAQCLLGLCDHRLRVIHTRHGLDILRKAPGDGARPAAHIQQCEIFLQVRYQKIRAVFDGPGGVLGNNTAMMPMRVPVCRHRRKHRAEALAVSTLATPKSSPNSGGVLLLLLSHCEDPKANRRENPTQTTVWSEIRTTGRSIERKRSALPSSFIIFALENATPVNSKTPHFRGQVPSATAVRTSLGGRTASSRFPALG